MAGKFRICWSERSLDQVIKVTFILLEEFVELFQRLFEVTQSRISVLRKGIEVLKLLSPGPRSTSNISMRPASMRSDRGLKPCTEHALL
jgi:hypothetical protein